jgi:hypothetical protein
MNSEALRNIAQQEKWLDALVAGEGRSSATEVLDELSTAYRNDVIEALGCDITGGRCKATTRQQFYRWYLKRLATHIKRYAPFHTAAHLKRKNGPLTVDAIRSIAFMHRPENPGKPFPPYVIHDGNVEIRLGAHVLRAPQYALDWLRLCWPFSVQKGKLVKSTVRESNRGTWKPRELALHNLFVAFEHRGVPFEKVIALDGDFLNWTHGNLVPMGYGRKLGESERQFLIAKNMRESLSARKYDSEGLAYEGAFYTDPASVKLLEQNEAHFIDGLSRPQLNQMLFEERQVSYRIRPDGSQIESADS